MLAARAGAPTWPFNRAKVRKTRRLNQAALLIEADAPPRPHRAGTLRSAERTQPGVSASPQAYPPRTRGLAPTLSCRVLARPRGRTGTRPQPPPFAGAGLPEVWRQRGGRPRETPCRGQQVSPAPPFGSRAGRASPAAPATRAPPRPPVGRPASPPPPRGARRPWCPGSLARYLLWQPVAEVAGKAPRHPSRRSNSENNGATTPAGAPHSSERPPP